MKRFRSPVVLLVFLMSGLFSASLAAEGSYSSAAERMREAAEHLTEHSILREGPAAGSRGAVRADGDRIVFEDGTPALFWGIGVTFTTSGTTMFPPPKEEAEAFAKLVKAYGFNLVRFVGIDNSLRPLCAQWQRTGAFGGPIMDRLDYLIAMLRKHGIYYSFSINNSALCPLDALPTAVRNRHPAPWRRYHGVRLVHPAMRQQQIDWIASLFEHHNPYTDTTYAKDPANVYVAAVNEDSIWDVYFRNGKYLSASDKTVLNEDFKRWGGARGFERNSLDLWKPRGRLSPEDRRAVYAYLMYLDSRLVVALKQRLRALGYRGLITATNNWYGYGALETAVRHGDFVEVHGYFDHPRGRGAASRITGRSFLRARNLDEYWSELATRDWSFPLPKATRSAVAGKPLIVGEWNHAAWSPYAYEGPLLMYGYGATQGYSGLVAHTWFPYPASRTGPDVAVDAFAVATNPTFLRLSPVLAAAWRMQCLGPAPATHEISLGATTEELVDRAFAVSLNADPAVPFTRDRFLRRTRVSFPPHSPASGARPSEPQPTGAPPADLRGPKITFETSPTGGSLVMRGRCFFGAAFSGEDGGAADFRGYPMRMDSRGALALVALDGKRPSQSQDLLIAVTGSPGAARSPSRALPFRLAKGAEIAEGGVSAAIPLPGPSCPKMIGRFDSPSAGTARLTASDGGVCLLQIRSDRGVWARIRGGVAAVSLQ